MIEPRHALGAFPRHQPDYAAAGLATFPCDGATKRPIVSNYLRAGRPASSGWARKFADADAFGFACGARSGLSVLDIDAPDENLLTDAMALVGESPVVVQTASGKFHAWYRHGGEGRSVRKAARDMGLAGPVDILGNGFALAPGSITPAGEYRFVAGGLDDVARLPRMRLPVAGGADLNTASAPRQPAPVAMGERNTTLFRALLQAARTCSDEVALTHYAVEVNAANAQPLPAAEVARTVASVWKMQAEGRNWSGAGQRLDLRFDDLDRLLPLGPDVVSMCLYLRRQHWGGSSFFIANAMREAMPDGVWTQRRFKAARAALLTAGIVVEVTPANYRTPALFKFAANLPAEHSQGKRRRGV